MVRLPVRRGPREEGDACRDAADAYHLALADRLAQHPGAVSEEEDQARRERRLDECERDEQERSDLRRPAGQGEPGSDQPHRATDEADEQRGTEGVLLGNLAGLPGLEGDRGRVQNRRPQGRENSRKDEH